MPNFILPEVVSGNDFFVQALLEYMIGNCKQNLTDAEIILVQPKVEQVVNEDFIAHRLSIKNILAVPARLPKAMLMPLYIFLVDSTAADANIANAVKVLIQLLLINKDAFQDDIFREIIQISHSYF